MQSFFITGTDTNIGKTLVSTIITQVLNGYYWKPIQSCVATETSDPDKVKNLSTLTHKHIIDPVISLNSCLAPDQAAILQGLTISFDQIQIPVQKALIVEGIGGGFTPLSEDLCMFDLMRHLNLPIILVSKGTSNAVNHALLTIEALLHRKLKIKGIVFSGEFNHACENTVTKWSGIKTLFQVPLFENLSKEVLQAWIGENNDKIKSALL